MTNDYKEWKKKQRRALFEAGRDNLDIDLIIDLYFRVHWDKHNPAVVESFKWIDCGNSEVEEARTRLKRQEYFPFQKHRIEIIASTNI